MPKLRFLLIPFAALAMGLGGCTEEKETPKNDDAARGAAGEVLGGTISDDMINYEQIQSRAATIAEEPEAASGSGGGSSSQSASAPAAPAQPAPPAPAPEPETAEPVAPAPPPAAEEAE